MTIPDKIVDAVIWLFNLLTFLAASLAFFGLCVMSYKSPNSVKGFGDFVFVALIFVVSGGIVWKTGQWFFFKPSQIFVPGLFSFWVFLLIIYMAILTIIMGDSVKGLGPSGGLGG